MRIQKSVKLVAAAVAEVCIPYNVRTSAVLAISSGTSCDRSSCNRCCGSSRCSGRNGINIITIRINSISLIVTERCAACCAIYEAVCIPRSEIKLIILILNYCVTLRACLLICQTAVPKSSFKCHNLILLIFLVF